MEGVAVKDSVERRKAVLERWKAALPNIVGDQRELVQETIVVLESSGERMLLAAHECDLLGAHYDNLVEKAERSGPSAPGYVTDATWHGWIGAASAYRRCAAIVRDALKDKVNDA